MEVLAIILFISLFLLILYGYPVAFTLGGLSVLYALCFFDPLILNALPMRIMGVMSNYVLLAVPLFVFMGIMLERSGIAEELLESSHISHSCGSLAGRLHRHCRSHRSDHGAHQPSDHA
jgi:TRAP-type mannitol/chloroaromatic compound transport system permease large subunit